MEAIKCVSQYYAMVAGSFLVRPLVHSVVCLWALNQFQHDYYILHLHMLIMQQKPRLAGQTRHYSSET